MNHFFKQKQPYVALIVVFFVILLLGVAQLDLRLTQFRRIYRCCLFKWIAGRS